MFNNISTTAGRQLLPLGKLTTQAAALALRKGSVTGSVDSASQFIPLLNWEEDRISLRDLSSLPTLSEPAKSIANKGSRPQVDSDASISSSSDEEFEPAARRVRGGTVLKSRRKN